MARRVVVTGLGVVTALGCEIPEFWDRLCAGKSGVGPLRRFDVRNFKVRFAGEINGFDATEHIDTSPKELKRMDRFVQFGLVAASKAITQSGINLARRRPLSSRRADRQRHRRPQRDRKPARRALQPWAGSRLAVHDSQADGQRRQREYLGQLGLERPQQCRRHGLCLGDQRHRRCVSYHSARHGRRDDHRRQRGSRHPDGTVRLRPHEGPVDPQR